MPKQVLKYTVERENIINKLLEILEIKNNESQQVVFLHTLDDNVDKQKAILDLIPDVKQYFICGHWTCFCKDNVKRVWLSIIKYIMKDMNYNMIPCRTTIKKDNNFISVTYYKISKNTD